MFRSRKAISNRGKPTTLGVVGLVGFLSVFTAMGLVFAWLLVIGPALRISAARNWPATPCTVLSSELETHSGDGTTYSIEITYEYEYNGNRYTSDRYSFSSTGSSSGRKGKAKVVDAHPPGRETVCYVNPSDPQDAVLHRGFTADMWFGLIPLIFVAVGAGGIIFTLRSWLRSRQQRALALSRGAARQGDRDDYLPAFDVGAGPATLKPRQGRWTKLLFSLLVAAFWNGIVSVFLAQVVKDFLAGDPEWFLTIFIIPFLAIGLGLIGWVFYNLLSLVNPRPMLTVSSSATPLGCVLDLAWDMTGRTQRIRDLRVTFEGEEQATYTRGTDTVTDNHTFAEILLFDTDRPLAMSHGSASVTVPANTMHSLEAPNNDIVWSIRFHGDVPRWPDVDERFGIVLLPAQGGGA